MRERVENNRRNMTYFYDAILSRKKKSCWGEKNGIDKKSLQHENGSNNRHWIFFYVN